MSTTKNQIAKWFDIGVKNGATHLVVACDTMDLDDYPIYVSPADDVRKVVAPLIRGDNMQRLMEVYHLGSDRDRQLAEPRSYNYEPLSPLTPLPGGKTGKNGKPLKSKLAALVERHKKPKGRPTLTLIEGGKK